MKTLISRALVLCMALIWPLACGDGLYDLAGEHDITILYSNDPNFSSTYPFWVREVYGEAHFGHVAAPETLYFRILNESQKNVTLIGSGPTMYIVEIIDFEGKFNFSSPPPLMPHSLWGWGLT